MTPQPPQPEGTPDVLEVRLDALLKNFQQIADTKAEVEGRVKEVKDLHDLAMTHHVGIDDRLEDILEDVDTTRKRLAKLAARLDPGVLKVQIETLERVVGLVNDVHEDFRRMLEIIERMSEGWKRTTIDRLNMLDTTLLHQSGVRIKKIEGFQEQLEESGAQREGIWNEYETLAYREGDTLFGEYVDFVGGLALRNTGLDHGVCQMADDLIGRLCRIGGTEIFHSMTLPARRAASRKTIARIIRMGFPEWTVWAVPLGVHEFGHVVIDANPELRQHLQNPDVNRRWGFCSPGELSVPHQWTFLSPELEVYLADAFATCAMGPAYACATVLLRLDPYEEDAAERRRIETETTLPGASPDSRRAHVILKTLELMAEPADDYEGVRSMLFDAWSDTLAAFGLQFDLGREAKRLDACAEVMWEFLSERSSHLMYKPSRYAESERWPNLLTVDGRPNAVAGIGSADGSADPFAMIQEIAVRDVLNMAWRERLSAPENAAGERADRMAEQALALWREIFQSTPTRDRTWEQPMRGADR